ncbi:MAG TPA: hypothetical protein VHL53_00765 [Acidimicrobiia bacterium]|nr:hypothetical protein [Acidimicrobiia bacterium]
MNTAVNATAAQPVAVAGRSCDLRRRTTGPTRRAGSPPTRPAAGARRGWAREAEAWEGRLAAAETAFDHGAGPEAGRLDETIRNLEADQRSGPAQAERDAWLAEHPEAKGPQAAFDLDDLVDRLRRAVGWQT